MARRPQGEKKIRKGREVKWNKRKFRSQAKIMGGRGGLSRDEGKAIAGDDEKTVERKI